MKYLMRISSVISVVFLLLSPTYSSDYNYDEINSPKTSKVSLFKTALIGLAALSAPVEADISGCYFGVATNQRNEYRGAMRVTRIAPAIGYDPNRCSVYPPPPDDRFRNISMDIVYSCDANTYCKSIGINQIRLCSGSFNVSYPLGNFVTWDYLQHPCTDCFALTGFYGNGGRDGTEFANTFQSFLSNGTCP